MSMSHDEMIAVIQAQRDGKEIEAMSLDAGLPWGLRENTETEASWIRVWVQRDYSRSTDSPTASTQNHRSVRQASPLRSPIRKQVHVREVLPDEEKA